MAVEPAGGAGQLEDGDLGTGVGGLDGGAAAGAAEADDGDVGLHVPAGDLAEAARLCGGGFLGHWAGAETA